MDSKREKNSTQNLPLDCWCHIITFLSTRSDFMSLVFTIKGLLRHVRVINPFCAVNVPFRLYHLPNITCREVSNLAIDNRTSKKMKKERLHPREDTHTFSSRFGKVSDFVDILKGVSERFPELQVLSFDIQLQLLAYRGGMLHRFVDDMVEYGRWTFKNVDFHNTVTISSFRCLCRLHIRIFCEKMSFTSTDGRFFPLLEHLSLERPDKFQSLIGIEKPDNPDEYLIQTINMKKATELRNVRERGELRIEWSCFPKLNELMLKGWTLQFSLNTIPSGKLKDLKLEDTVVLPEDKRLKIDLRSFVLGLKGEGDNFPSIEESNVPHEIVTVNSLELLVLQNLDTNGIFVNFHPGICYGNLKQIYLYSVRINRRCITFSQFPKLEKIYMTNFRTRRFWDRLPGEVDTEYVYFQDLPKLKDIRMVGYNVELECRDKSLKDSVLEIIQSDSQIRFGNNLERSLTSSNELQKLKILALTKPNNDTSSHQYYATPISVANKPKLEKLNCTSFNVSSILNCKSLKSVTSECTWSLDVTDYFQLDMFSMRGLESLESVHFKIPLQDEHENEVQDEFQVDPKKLEKSILYVFKSIKNCGSKVGIKKVAMEVISSEKHKWSGISSNIRWSEGLINYQNLVLKGPVFPEISDLLSFEGDRMCIRVIRNLTIDGGRGNGTHYPKKMVLRFGNAEVKIKNISSKNLVFHPNVEDFPFKKVSRKMEVEECEKLESLEIESLVSSYSIGGKFQKSIKTKIDIRQLKIILKNLPKLIHLSLGPIDVPRISEFQILNCPIRRLSINLNWTNSTSLISGELKSVFRDLSNSMTIAGKDFPLLEELVIKTLPSSSDLQSYDSLFKLKSFRNLSRLKFIYIQRSTKIHIVERIEGLNMDSIVVGSGKGLPQLGKPILRVDLENVMTLREFMNQFR